MFLLCFFLCGCVNTTQSPDVIVSPNTNAQLHPTTNEDAEQSTNDIVSVIEPPTTSVDAEQSTNDAESVIKPQDITPEEPPTEQPTTTVQLPAPQYATALKEFIDNATGETNAVLFDLDGCGSNEMIAFDEGIFTNGFWANPTEGAMITVYDVKDDEITSSSVEPYFNILSYELYITTRNYLVVTYTDHGLFYAIYKYESGVLMKICVIYDYTYANTEGPFVIDGIEHSESEFMKTLGEFGVHGQLSADIEIVIGYGEWWRDSLEVHGLPTPANDSAIILDMTT